MGFITITLVKFNIIWMNDFKVLKTALISDKN